MSSTSKLNANAPIFVPSATIKTSNSESKITSKNSVLQTIDLLIGGYLRDIGLQYFVTVLKNAIEAFYVCTDNNPNNFIANMKIDSKLLNDVVALFSTPYGVVRTDEHSQSDMVYLSLQSQAVHSIKCRQHQFNGDLHFWNGNLISVNGNLTIPIMYNIASNTIYKIPPFVAVNVDRMNIGLCVSAQRGIFSIGGYYEDKDWDSVNVVHNVGWSWNGSNCEFGAVRQLKPYWHDTWCSTPLFIDNDNKVINIGGGEGRRGHCSQIVSLYDFESNEWSKVADIPYHSQSSGACYNKFDETIYVSGGYACDTDSCVRYSVHTDEWHHIAHTNWICDSRLSPLVSVIDNSLILVISEGGESDVMRMEYFDTRTSSKRFTVLVDDVNPNEFSDNRLMSGDRQLWYNLITNI